MTRGKQELIKCVNGVTDCRAAQYVGETPYCTALKEALYPCKFYKNEEQHAYDMYQIMAGNRTPITCEGAKND